MSKTKQFIAFDLDGVLIDSRANMEKAWSAVQLKFAINVPFENYFKLIGRPFAEILSHLGINKQQSEIETLFSATSTAYLDLIQFYPDAAKTLELFSQAGVKLGVVTSK